jgi:hypothetical protein
MTIIATTLVLSFVVILLVITGMSVGVLNGRRAISGSCGGLNGGGCELCSGSGACRKKRQQSREQSDGESA